jgi:hypothetical protein
MKSSKTLSNLRTKPVQKRPEPSSKKQSPPPSKVYSPEMPMQERLQESITDSMRSTPSKGQMLNNFPSISSFQAGDSPYRLSEVLKLPTFEKTQSSPPPSLNDEKGKIVRKDSRSQTTVNSQNIMQGPSFFPQSSENSTRRAQRTKTEVYRQEPSKSSQFSCFHNYSNSLSNNYNNERIPSRVNQREKNLIKNEIVVEEMKFKQEETERFEPENSSSKSFASYLKNGRRFSVASNASVNSFGLNEAQFELLSDLTKSVKELNQRLIRSEEVTYERLKENISLKTKIKNLEMKIDEQQNRRMDTEITNPGCSNNCRIF